MKKRFIPALAEAPNGFLNTMIHSTQHISNQVNVYLKCDYCFHSVSSLCIYLLCSRNDGNNGELLRNERVKQS